MNSGGRRLLTALALITLLTAAGTCGYMLIEHMSFEDALFMTVITITTVGYGEVKPLDTAGSVFTIALILTGVGTAYYVLAAVTEMVVADNCGNCLARPRWHVRSVSYANMSSYAATAALAAWLLTSYTGMAPRSW